MEQPAADDAEQLLSGAVTEIARAQFASDRGTLDVWVTSDRRVGWYWLGRAAQLHVESARSGLLWRDGRIEARGWAPDRTAFLAALSLFKLGIAAVEKELRAHATEAR